MNNTNGKIDSASNHGKKLSRPERQPLDQVVPLKTPYAVYIDPCGACNFACSFCPCNHSDYRLADRHAVMPLTMFRKIVDDLAKFPDRIRVVNVYGFGEPLLNPEIVPMIQYLKNKDVADEIFMVSNGALMTEKMADGLAHSGLTLYRISLEALNDENYRKFTGRSDISLEKIIKNVEMIYRASRKTSLKVEVKIVDTALSHEGGALKFQKLFGPITDYLRLEETGQIWSEYDSLASIDKTIRTKNENEICSRPFFQMAVHSNGDVSTCCADWKLKTVYGNVMNDSLYSLWNSKRLKSVQILHALGRRKEIDFCNRCEFTSPDVITEKMGVRMADSIRKSI